MGKKQQGGQQTSTQSPWSGIVPNLVGGPGTTGIYQAAHNLFAQNPNLVAPNTYWQNQGQNNALFQANNMAGQIAPYQSAAATALDRYQNPGQNPYFEDLMDSVTRPIERQFQFSTAPGVRSQFTLAGQPGSSRQGIVEGITRALANEDILGARAQVGTSLYNTDANQAFRSMALGPQTLGLGLMPSNIMRQVGGERQAQEQALLDQPFERLRRYAGIVQPGAGIGGTQTGPGPYTQSGGLMGALGGGLMGGMLGNAITYSPYAAGLLGEGGAAMIGGWPMILGGALLGGLL